MKNLKKLWAMGVGAIFGFAMYEAGRQDGENEGVAKGLSVGIDIGQNIVDENGEKAEVKIEVE